MRITTPSTTLTKTALSIGALMMAAVGCASNDGSEQVGTASVKIQVGSVHGEAVTRVVVSSASGAESDLTPDFSGGFAGTLLLPAGPDEIVGRAFIDDTLVGESAPVPVVVEAGLVVGASIRLIDLTGGASVPHRPFVVSIGHPLSTIANQTTLLSADAIDPDGDALTYAWSSDCADSVFSDASAPVTEWTNPTQGNCNLALTVSDGGLSAVESFRVVVFAEGADTGAVDIDGVFIGAPDIFLTMNSSSAFCDVNPSSEDGSCIGSMASPEGAGFSAFVSWGHGEPGTLEIADDCGGRFEIFGQDSAFIDGQWTPPVERGVCLVTVRATSPEGPSSAMTAAVLVRDGEAPPPPAPVQIRVDFNASAEYCTANFGETEVFCPSIDLGDFAFIDAEIDWAGQPVGSVDIFETCGGGEFSLIDLDPFFLHAEWRALLPGECRFHILALTPEGTTASEVILNVPVELF